jgi:hypothetical protein
MALAPAHECSLLELSGQIGAVRLLQRSTVGMIVQPFTADWKKPGWAGGGTMKPGRSSAENGNLR